MVDKVEEQIEERFIYDELDEMKQYLYNMEYN